MNKGILKYKIWLNNLNQKSYFHYILVWYRNTTSKIFHFVLLLSCSGVLRGSWRVTGTPGCTCDCSILILCWQGQIKAGQKLSSGGKKSLPPYILIYWHHNADILTFNTFFAGTRCSHWWKGVFVGLSGFELTHFTHLRWHTSKLKILKKTMLSILLFILKIRWK